VLAAAVLVLAAAIVGAGSIATTGPGRPAKLVPAGPRPGHPGHTVRAPDHPALRASWQAGVDLTANAAADYLDPGSDAAIQAARRDGSTSVAIVPTWYMAAGDSSQVAADPARTPSDAAVTHAVATATGLGMAVLLKPQVDVLDGTYRGRIAPTDRRAWFASYQTMIVHYTDLARQLNIGGLVIGVELGSMVERPADTAWWQGLIRGVRAGGYRGTLTYAANWDQLDTVHFWRSLTYIGIDAYFPLVPRSRQFSPTTKELVAAWGASYVSAVPRDWVSEVGRLQRAQRRPVLFTELGYGATACTAAMPYALVPRCAQARARTQPSERAQQNAYVAALRVWSRVPYIAGIYWWDWPTNANQAADFYSPRGRLAEQSIALWDAARGQLKAPQTGAPAAGVLARRR
jgi:hypothetical protein